MTETDASQDDHQSETGAESSGSEEHDHLSMPQGEGGSADAGNDTEEEADNGSDEKSGATFKNTACTLGLKLCGLIQELLKLCGPKKEKLKSSVLLF